ncbi:hypothetical protein [Actinotalea sp. Marseille-Q4924]|uniref:hypothetical protein n=1 Tax=Actinotalea sp. Marseille-Q4924 TaxID=2866571 RepID=UPI001CE45C64|nr:hypothetical protein [Actinotalea sp. Marseille-Q4924]
MTRAERRTLWVVGLTAAAVLVRLLEAGPPVQPVVIAAFLLVVPGASLVGGAPGWSWLLWATAVVACSVSLVTLVATGLLYAGWWSPDRVLAVLVVGSLISAASHHLSRRRAVEP